MHFNETCWLTLRQRFRRSLQHPPLLVFAPVKSTRAAGSGSGALRVCSQAEQRQEGRSRGLPRPLSGPRAEAAKRLCHLQGALASLANPLGVGRGRPDADRWCRAPFFQNREMRCFLDRRASAQLRGAPPPSHCPGETPACPWVRAARPGRLGQLKQSDCWKGVSHPYSRDPSGLRQKGWREDWFQSCHDLLFRGLSLAFSTSSITLSDLGCLVGNMGTGEAPGLGAPCALLGRTRQPSQPRAGCCGLGSQVSLQPGL